MPSFCRHNRLVQNCPICSREQSVDLRPLVSSAAPKVSLPRPAAGERRTAGGSSSSRSPGRGGAGKNAATVRVRRLERGAEDGFHSPLVIGLKSSTDAERLAQELAFAVRRLDVLEADPPGLCAEVAAAGDLEERTWLAFLIAYLCPLDDDDDPYAAIEAVRTTWSSGEDPDLEDVQVGPRSAHEPGRGAATIDAYRAWAARAGSQQAAFEGESSWTAERRFARVFERMALPGMHRDARFELLVLLGRLGVYDMRAGALQVGGANEVTLAAKRAFGIGDTMLLERRAADLAEACGLPLEALDLGLHNWGSGARVGLGVSLDTEPDPAALDRVRSALGLALGLA